MSKKNLYFRVIAILIASGSYAQVAVDVNMNVKHIVGNKSEFDRNKYITLHAPLVESEWPNQNMQETFLTNYDVYLGRSNGLLPWHASTIKEDANKPGWPDVNEIKRKSADVKTSYANNTFVHKFENRNDLMIGGQKGNYPTSNNISTCCGITPWKYANNEASAEFYAHFIKEAFGTGGTTGEPKPKYLEVINEPFVHANDMNTTNAKISEFHSAVAKRVKQLNPDILVGGFTAAHPQHVSNNFDHWNKNWKTFIDIAGADMDFFSFHLYDVQKKGTNIRTYRAGSNTEAIFDMIESYSVLKLGKVVPFNISEYGYFTPDLDGTDYTKERDWYNLRSFSSIMMQLMEKPDVIIKSMPFMLLKANWWSPPADQPADAKYPYRLFRQKKELAGGQGDEWVYTELVKFYQLWSDVKGTRVDTQAADMDTQVDAYINGKKMHLILNNLEHHSETIDLNLIDSENNPIENIKIKHLYENNGIPVLKETTHTAALDEVEIGREATMILEYTFKNDVLIDESSTESKIYADKYLQSINSGQANTFKFKTSELSKTAYGELILRLGVGRDHPTGNGAFVFPKVYFNDTEIDIPFDWRGYDQKSRDRFFGVLEIPVPYELIDPTLTPDNIVKVVFPNGGGHISSVVLQKFDFSSDIRKNGTLGIESNYTKTRFSLYPNPVTETVKIKGINSLPVTVEIFDLSGKSLAKHPVSGAKNSVDVSNLKPGTYIMKVSDEKHNEKIKFLKK
ncbi:T9SS type A sorting domain-containing protein [Tamlana sp. 2_MG-2023]|uniref:T9SS type A sorting domain-containing protein n=1 Tax=unclassified Tamlana TaxID=2614803 RepID=UPI0026E29481|nr:MULTISPECIES: T9SS type A sorting domain-containing protein [unclassified Tamlana]MDO6760452.1 T9SS type A sorting domain-containing protein [Tamlana sp. 2_MG-2023]MDO6790708.1 T9SS type A sorting domain-containing protein [Tamlana sp. 1_MG-2023]